MLYQSESCMKHTRLLIEVAIRECDMLFLPNVDCIPHPASHLFSRIKHITKIYLLLNRHPAFWIFKLFHLF